MVFGRKRKEETAKEPEAAVIQDVTGKAEVQPAPKVEVDEAVKAAIHDVFGKYAAFGPGDFQDAWNAQAAKANLQVGILVELRENNRLLAEILELSRKE